LDRWHSWEKFEHWWYEYFSFKSPLAIMSFILQNKYWRAYFHNSTLWKNAVIWLVHYQKSCISNNFETAGYLSLSTLCCGIFRCLEIPSRDWNFLQIPWPNMMYLFNSSEWCYIKCTTDNVLQILLLASRWRVKQRKIPQQRVESDKYPAVSKLFEMHDFW
jgi:hypothetical protein